MSKTRFKLIGSPLYKRAMEAAKSAANVNMNRCGRKLWNEEDYSLHAKMFYQIMEELVGYKIKETHEKV